jgi:hypothetical protein
VTARARGDALVEDAKDRSMEAHEDFILALRRIETGKSEKVKIRPRQPITPTMLAQEAGRARSQLYATHRDLLERLKEVNAMRVSVSSEKKKSDKKSELDLREIITRLSRDKELLAQQNFRLQRRIDELEDR